MQPLLDTLCDAVKQHSMISHANKYEVLQRC